MAIYIKGMEMPKNCEECRMAEVAYEGFCHAANKWFDDEWFVWSQYEEGDIDTSKPLNCPLVYIPEPHGRLIDADSLVKSAKDFEEDGGTFCVDDIFDLEDWLDTDAPTVVERSD